MEEMKTTKKKMKTKIHNLCILFLPLFFTGLNMLSRNSKEFTDWYRLHIFPAWTGMAARASSLFGGSAGEMLIMAGICLLLAEALMLPVFAGGYIMRRRQGRQKSREEEQAGNGDGSNKGWKLQRLGTWNVRFLCWVFIYIYGTETLGCFMLYHVPTVEEQYFGEKAEYGAQELADAYAKVVTCANALSAQVERDGDGNAVYGGSDKELYAKCKEAMRAQGGTYPYLAGYYPDPKPIRASYFMSQQYLLGIYFPFTMEANYNTVMYPVNVPATVCHEFSHLKGVIREDEANYFGFVACIESDEPYLQYSGYLGVLGYLAGQVRKSVPEEIRLKLPNANETVLRDDVFLTQEQWEQVEKRAVLPTETVNKATDAFLEKNLTMNGVEEGIQSYSQVVRLVIKYLCA